MRSEFQNWFVQSGLRWSILLGSSQGKSITLKKLLLRWALFASQAARLCSMKGELRCRSRFILLAAPQSQLWLPIGFSKIVSPVGAWRIMSLSLGLPFPSMSTASHCCHPPLRHSMKWSLGLGKQLTLLPITPRLLFLPSSHPPWITSLGLQAMGGRTRVFSLCGLIITPTSLKLVESDTKSLGW